MQRMFQYEPPTTDFLGESKLKRGYFISDEELAQRDEGNKLRPVILERQKIGTNTVSLVGITYDSKEGIHHYEVGVQKGKGGPITIAKSKGDILSAVDSYLDAINVIEQKANNEGLLSKLKRFFGKVQDLSPKVV